MKAGGCLRSLVGAREVGNDLRRGPVKAGDRGSIGKANSREGIG